MGKRITSFDESPCYKCGYQAECTAITRRVPEFKIITDSMFGRADKDYHDCGLWIKIEVEKNGQR